GQCGGGTVQVWDRGYWEPAGERSPEESLAGGELKFVLDGRRLKGTWVLVRLRSDSGSRTRANWLLIKTRDAHAQPGSGAEVLAEERSVASGRRMEEIASGRGRRPRPFMQRAGTRIAADAVWHSNRAGTVAAEERAVRKSASARDARKASLSGKGSQRSPSRRTKRKAGKPPPKFVPPQLATLVERPPQEAGWGHEIKIDGYRIQLRLSQGDVTLRTRKGLDWTAKFPAIATEVRSLDDCLIDGEVAAFDSQGVISFPALQAALGKTEPAKLVYFAFDLLFLGGRDLRSLALRERKQALKELLAGVGRERDSPITYVEHFEASGEDRKSTRLNSSHV